MFAAKPGRLCTARSMAANSWCPTGSGAAATAESATACSRDRSATPNCLAVSRGVTVSRSIQPLIRPCQRSRSAALAPAASCAMAAIRTWPWKWSLRMTLRSSLLR